VAKSRTGPWLLIALIATPAGAQQTADQAIAAQRSGLREALRLDCPPAEGDEIVVCGSRQEEDRRQRLAPLSGAGGAGGRAGGEQRAALAIDSGSCTTVGRDQQCTSGLDMVGIGFAIARAVAQAIANRD